MDVTDQIRQHRRTYGSSDNTRAHFTLPEYVLWGSPKRALDLGIAKEFKWELIDTIGSVDGTNTFFIRFTTTQETRIGARRVSVHPQYDVNVYIRLADGNLDPIALGADGYAGSGQPTTAEILALPPQVTYIGYVVPFYWFTGYCVEDESRIEQSTYSLNLGDESLEAFARGSPFATILPPGTYYLIVGTGEWQQQPFHVQLAAIGALDLEATAEFKLELFGRESTSQLEGDVTLALSPQARFTNFFEVQSDIDFGFTPSGSIDITSPVS